MRRSTMRGHDNILKRLLIHVGAFNISLHGCPVKSRTESVGWDELVTLLGSQISEVPVEWVFSRTG
jgi:hypothetical protein